MVKGDDEIGHQDAGTNRPRYASLRRVAATKTISSEIQIDIWKF